MSNVTDYDAGFDARLDGLPLDATKSSAWQTGWAEADYLIQRGRIVFNGTEWVEAE